MKEAEMNNPNILGQYHRDIMQTRFINKWHVEVVMSCGHIKLISRVLYKKYKSHATLCLKCGQ